MTPPKVSYIVSAHSRPRSLVGCLASLQIQTAANFEVIVADNGAVAENEAVVKLFDWRFRYVNTAQYACSPGWDSYWSSEWIANHEAKGEWFCFPSDDSYYVPIFQAAMLEAAERSSWNLVYCEMLYDRRLRGRYGVMDVAPVLGRIDKTGFLIHRDSWIGFPTKRNVLGPCGCDGEMIEFIIRHRKVRHGKVNEVLVVHN